MNDADTQPDIHPTLAIDVGDFYSYFQREAPAEIQQSLRLYGIPIDPVTHESHLAQALRHSVERLMATYFTISTGANSSAPLVPYAPDLEGPLVSHNPSTDIANEIQALEYVDWLPVPPPPASSKMGHAATNVPHSSPSMRRCLPDARILHLDEAPIEDDDDIPNGAPHDFFYDTSDLNMTCGNNTWDVTADTHFCDPADINWDTVIAQTS